MTTSEAYLDLGGNLPEFDYAHRALEHAEAVNTAQLNYEDMYNLVAPFARLAVGTQHPDWLLQPYMAAELTNSNAQKAAHAAFMGEYAALYGKINQRFQLATLDAEPTAMAFAGLLRMFRLPGEPVDVSTRSPQMVQLAAKEYTRYTSHKLRPETRRHKTVELINRHQGPGRVGSRMNANGLPELYILDEVASAQMASVFALKVGDIAIKQSQTGPSAA